MPPESQARLAEPPVNAGVQPTESTALLNEPQHLPDIEPSLRASDDDSACVDKILPEQGVTTWRAESVILIKSTAPLTATFALQYSLTIASIVSIGHLGKIELGGVTLGVMSGNITGMMIFMGLSTSLDTLCAQAYGSGNKELVGLYLQRMLTFFAIISVPMALLWWFSAPVLALVIPDPRIVAYANRYLRILIIGLPGYASFEAGKRFMQAQGLFTASTYVMLFCAPLNALMNWALVWKFQLGFDGAAIAVVITYTLLPIGLISYAYFIAGSECWYGFSKKILSNWGPMIRLAIPGLIMLEAEVVAFEILTFAAARFDATTLAAQSELQTLVGCAFQIPFALSVAGGTRIGNLIGASLADAAQTAAKVTIGAAATVGTVNLVIFAVLRHQLPLVFSSDADVVALTAQVVPFLAGCQLFDALATGCNGVLRGVGRQRIGGYVQLFAYYVVALPISFSTAFKLDWRLFGLWAGVYTAITLVFGIEVIYIRYLDWQKCIDAAKWRTSLG